MAPEPVEEIYSRGKRINNRLSESDRLYTLHHILDLMMAPVLLLLLAVLYFEFFATLSHQQHVLLLQAQKLILAYFVIEILVDFALYENNKKFFKNKWFDILLVLPFFSILKGLRGLKILKLGKLLKPAKAAKAGKAAKVGNAGKVARVAKHGKKAQHTTKFFKKSWEKIAGKLIGD